MTILRSRLLNGSFALTALGVVLAATVSSPGLAQALVDASATAVADLGSTLPAVTGPNAVGRTEFALTDTSRADPFAADGRPRELAVWIWYPTTDRDGSRAPYLPADWTALVNNVGPLMQDLTAVRTGSIANAALEGRPPAIVLMPGLGQPVASYTALAEDFASHGYGVVGINPTGSTDVVFPDGHAVMTMPPGVIAEALLTDFAAWQAEAARITNVWADDAAFVVETLATGSAQIGALDFGRVAYLGHSLGGAAAFEACSRDESCAGAVDLDGTLWTEVRQTGLGVPNLVLRQAPGAECDAFCQSAAADFATVRTAGNSQQFYVAGSKHFSFTDLGLVPSPGNNEEYRGALDPARMISITRDMVRSFLDMSLDRAPAADLAAVAGQYPELIRY